MIADYTVGGPLLHWTNYEQFDGGLSEGAQYRVVGWARVDPSIGQTMMAEFEKSWIKFEVTEVNPQRDPPDMFFATVTPIDQEMK